MSTDAPRARDACPEGEFCLDYDCRLRHDLRSSDAPLETFSVERTEAGRIFASASLGAHVGHLLMTEATARHVHHALGVVLGEQRPNEANPEGHKRLIEQALRAVRAWEDDPTGIYTENAIRELGLRAGSSVDAPCPQEISITAAEMREAEGAKAGEPLRRILTESRTQEARCTDCGVAGEELTSGPICRDSYACERRQKESNGTACETAAAEPSPVGVDRSETSEGTPTGDPGDVCRGCGRSGIHAEGCPRLPRVNADGSVDQPCLACGTTPCREQRPDKAPTAPPDSVTLAELREVIRALWGEAFASSDGALWDRLKELLGPDVPAPRVYYVPLAAVLDLCEKERVYWNRRCEGGDLPPSPNDASDGWAAAENIAYAVRKLVPRSDSRSTRREPKSTTP